MKKFVYSAMALLVGSVCWADNMQFVTTLSSPVGTFSTLETADPTTMVTSPVVNFCNSRVSVGNINLAGADAYLKNLYLEASTTLGGTAPEYRISSALQMENGGTLEGGRLMALEVTFENAASAKSEVTNTLFLSSSSKVKGAKTTVLTIPGKVETVGEGSGESLEWSNAYPCDYHVTEAEEQYPFANRMVRYNADNGRFENNEGLSTYDTCDGNPLTEYSGTPSEECVDIWLYGSRDNMIANNLGTIIIYQSGDGCGWNSPCGAFYEIVPVCNARLPQGWQVTDGSDITSALSSRNSYLTADQRWKYYVPTKAKVQHYFGALKTTYERWLNNMDWELGHPYTFNVCTKDAVATDRGIMYTLSYGTTSFRATQHLPEAVGGNVECVTENKYSSFLLKSK